MLRIIIVDYYYDYDADVEDDNCDEYGDTVLAYKNGTLDRFDVSLGAKRLFVCLFLPNKMQSYYEKIH